MSYASTAISGPVFGTGRVTIPRWRWPWLPVRFKAVAMVALMISPVYLCDAVGYGIKRLSFTAGQIAEMRRPDETLLSRFTIFHVACVDPQSTGADQRWWTANAQKQGWPMYPEAGPNCFRPDRALLGIVGLKSFNVACPTMILSDADRHQWVRYVADRGWGPYPQAGADCVDP